MTTTSLKPVTRLTSAYVRDRGLRPILVTITGSMLEFRAQGLRTRESLDVASLYLQAVKQRVAAEKALKKSNRKNRRAL